MNAHSHILLILILVIVPVLGAGRWTVKKMAGVRRSLRLRAPASLWKRAASIEPHVRPPVGGAVVKQVAIHVARRHHAPLPKEPGKLWR